MISSGSNRNSERSESRTTKKLSRTIRTVKSYVSKRIQMGKVYVGRVTVPEKTGQVGFTDLVYQVFMNNSLVCVLMHTFPRVHFSH